MCTLLLIQTQHLQRDLSRSFEKWPMRSYVVHLLCNMELIDIQQAKQG